MQNQPRLNPMRPSDFMGQQAPLVSVRGTISRDQGENSYFYTGYDGQKVGDRIPFPVSKAVLERGRERYNIYCAPCHARTGDGNGMIVQRGYRRPPSYHTDRLRNVPLGHFFEVITNGFGAMPDYSAQIDPRDRWAITAYIRVLQFSQDAPVELLPENAKISPPPTPGTPGSGATPAQAEPQSGNLPAAEGPPSQLQRKAAKEQQKEKQKEEKVQQK